MGPRRRHRPGRTRLIANFLFIPYYPVWSILIVALDVAVIWALCVWNRDTA